MSDGRVIIIYTWPRLLPLELAGAYLGLSPKTIINHKYQLPGRRKWGGKLVFDRVALDKLIDRSVENRNLWLDADRLAK